MRILEHASRLTPRCKATWFCAPSTHGVALHLEPWVCSAFPAGFVICSSHAPATPLATPGSRGSFTAAVGRRYLLAHAPNADSVTCFRALPPELDLPEVILHAPFASFAAAAQIRTSRRQIRTSDDLSLERPGLSRDASLQFQHEHQA